MSIESNSFQSDGSIIIEVYSGEFHGLEYVQHHDIFIYANEEEWLASKRGEDLLLPEARHQPDENMKLLNLLRIIPKLPPCIRGKKSGYLSKIDKS